MPNAEQIVSWAAIIVGVATLVAIAAVWLLLTLQRRWEAKSGYADGTADPEEHDDPADRTRSALRRSPDARGSAQPGDGLAPGGSDA